MYEDSITIVQLRQFSFCPRIPWYQVNSYAPVKENLWMTQGSEYHLDRESLLKKRLLKKFQNQKLEIKFRVNVFSKKYGIHGIVDAVLKNEEEVFPVEFKMNPNPHSQGTRNQLLGYILCLEEVYGKKVPMGFIISGKNAKVTEMKFSEEEKNKLVETIGKVRVVQESSFLPDSSASIEKCMQCEYLNFCNDRNV
jgi:CRISPR-associated exonuclease Cas4